MRKSTIIMGAAVIVAAIMFSQSLYAGSGLKTFLLTFFAVGLGLGLLRLFVNSSIKKLKGKGWLSKILFFGALIGLGLPFQNWFRKEVILSMNPEYLASILLITVTGLVFITAFVRRFFTAASSAE